MGSLFTMSYWLIIPPEKMYILQWPPQFGLHRNKPTRRWICIDIVKNNTKA